MNYKKIIFPIVYFLCFLAVFAFLFSFDILIVRPASHAAVKIAFPDISPPTGSIRINKTKVVVNEIFNITITGRDNQDIASMFVFYGGIWRRAVCEGIQKRCTKKFIISKDRPGTFALFGFIRDKAGNGSWTSPRKIEVEVIARDIIPPTGTITIDKAAAKIRETFTVTVTGKDNQGVRDIFFHDGDKWRRYRCRRDQLVCVKNWRISKQRPGAFAFYGFVRDTAGPNPGQGSWIGPANIIITE